MNFGEKGQLIAGISLTMIIAAIVILGLVAVILANLPQTTGGVGAVSQLCQATIGGIVDTFPCDQIPFEAATSGVAITVVGTGVAGATQTTSITPVLQVTTISFSVNPFEQFLQGSNTGTLTVSPKVNGVFESDFNSAVSKTLPANASFDYLVGDDDGAGTDYYTKWVTGRNAGVVSPLSDAVFLVREGTLTSTITNSNGVTLNTVTAMADINSSQTYYFNIKSENNTAYSCFGNPNTTSKVLGVIDANATHANKVSYFGIASVAGTGAPPTHTRDGNSTASWTYIVPSLNLCNGDSVNYKVKFEALSNMGTDDKFTSWLSTFFDYTIYKNSDTGQVIEGVYNTTTNADIGASNPTVRGYYQ